MQTAYLLIKYKVTYLHWPMVASTYIQNLLTGGFTYSNYQSNPSIFSEGENLAQSIHSSFPWRSLAGTGILPLAYPPSLYDRSLLSIYGNILGQSPPAGSLPMAPSSLGTSPFGHLTPPGSIPSTSATSGSSTYVTSGSASARAAAVASGLLGSSLYAYRFHPYLTAPKG